MLPDEAQEEKKRKSQAKTKKKKKKRSDWGRTVDDEGDKEGDEGIPERRLHHALLVHSCDGEILDRVRVQVQSAQND
jgi:hypothetical protein